MTLPRLEAIVKYWDDVPPLAVSAAQIASTLGVAKPRMFAKSGEMRAPEKKAGMAELAGDLSGAKGFVMIGAGGV